MTRSNFFNRTLMLWFILFNSSGLSASTIIYCPTQINCNKTGCDLNPETAKYFSLSANATECVDANRFQYAFAPYHSASTSGSCRYVGAHPGTCAGITLTLKPESNLEAYYQPNLSAWNFLTQGAECSSVTANSCPLKERLGFVLHNVNITDGIILSENGRNLNKLTEPNKYTGITDEDALIACGNIAQCNLELLSGKFLKYGSIRIDMGTMRILEITNALPTKIQINKIEPFNSLEISYKSFKKTAKHTTQRNV